MLFLQSSALLLELLHAELSVTQQANSTSTLFRAFKLLLLWVASLSLATVSTGLNRAELAINHFLSQRSVHFSHADLALARNNLNRF